MRFFILFLSFLGLSSTAALNIHATDSNQEAEKNPEEKEEEAKAQS